MYGKPKLKPKEKKVADNYIKGDNKALAVQKAGYNVKPTNAKSLGYQVLNRPHVKEYVKSVLDANSLSVEELAVLAQQSIHKNIEGGRPSQAVAASMIQYAFKLHDALPTQKSIKANVHIVEELGSKSFVELKESLQKVAKTSSLLLEDLKK